MKLFKSLVLTFVLLLASSSAFALTPPAKSAHPSTADTSAVKEAPRLIVYYFHGNVRCTSCKKIEAYTKEAVQVGFAEELKGGQIELRSINVEKPENRHFVQDFQLYTRSVVLESHLPGFQHWRNLDQVWRLVRNEEAFKAYVEKEVRSMLEGSSV